MTNKTEAERYRAGWNEEVARRQAAQELLSEALEALEGVVRVADRATLEFDRARAVIAKLKARS